MKRTVLFVGMIDSPHSARWIDLVADMGWDLHFFPVYMDPPHPIMRGVTIHHPWLSFCSKNILENIKLSLKSILSKSNIEVPLGQNLPVHSIYPIRLSSKLGYKLHGIKTQKLGESDVRAPLAFGPRVLKRLIKQLKPDLIHSMEFQHAGYTVLRAKEIFGKSKFPNWLATNWGSDIYYYGQFPDHKAQISRLLQSIDYYSCECHRDVELAKNIGTKARIKAVLLNTGGFDIEKISTLRSLVKTSSRRVIMIKGYQSFAGRALTALDSLERCADLLKDYSIVIYSASTEILKRVEVLRLMYDLNISTYGPLELSHEKMLEYFSEARIYLGVSVSDAISTSLLEAMAAGAFPLQTNTSCCEEWIKDGQSGFSIPADNVNVIAEKLRRALTNDRLMDSAAEINWSVVCNRLDKKIIRESEINLYNHIFDEMSI